MAALRAGQMLEGTSYQVVAEIGAGGMGVVYEVEHVRLKKRYVAKLIHDQISGDAGAQKRMEREAQVLAEINHPNVVQVHDVGTTSDGKSYFVMEKLEGADLRHAIKTRSIRRHRAVGIIIDVLDALAHVHQRGIVHRDIKPENVFLARQPNGVATKVLDFGIVHIFDGDRSSQGRITKTGGFVGTLYYAAPEQMQGRPAGPPNDVYAAGLVLYEMLVGKGPFDDDPGVGLSRCFKPAPRLETGPATPKELADAIADALEQEPAKRPSASELAARLRAVLANATTFPGGESEALLADVDDLLAKMPLRGPTVGNALGALVAPTEAPPTPLMHNAPGRAAAPIAPTAASAGVGAGVGVGDVGLAPTGIAPIVGSPLLSRSASPHTALSVAAKPTLANTPAIAASYSPANTPAPAITASPGVTSASAITAFPADTSPGVSATLTGGPTSGQAPRASALGMVSAIAGFLLVAGIGITAVVFGIRSASSHATSSNAAAAPALAPAPPAPSVTDAPPAASSATDPKMERPTDPAPPSNSAKLVAPAAASASALPSPLAAPAKTGRAKKEGYVEQL